MFSLYGYTGPTFTGTLEELGAVRAASRIRPVRALRRDDEARIAGRVAAQSDRHLAATGAEAIHSYQAAEHSDLERGPLYQAFQIMHSEVIVVHAADDVASAWRVLREHKIHQSPVLDADHQLVGIVSERDLLTVLNVEAGELRDVLARKVKDIMTSPVVTADPGTDIRRVARVMLDFGVDGVPIVDNAHALVGFISRSDILNAVVTDPPLSLWR